ncbi:carbon monoxide dehydrogenase [Sulfolobus sp. A20]|uniref:FAD binding domain-containing protein n=1 Tax=Sulfolobaceae TaxID=118883 RepID=UPI000845EE70|nr:MULTISPECIES: FAD binding domain-containing protein [unclassified Sulfolobus]TRM76524.1 carbon monoxide dehydrogenase [Sulfolobus sp. A20-N-F8]TRM83869.1 carbon monoxide dehydrogenase [Sulfolobus sp. A20-N-F6]TRM89465.1 carbon monoxide dehydrogenase [Sulfolobus sp. C3]TRM92844.1 carbon monoxide dehydrogenase [Sulfolobus sp. A20-N-G8]TRN00070.1 carbon monoxide dehydrogenase [Sulfolobus sp. E1]TRN03178.1 carbon monoxide dehydrogenase [Sulfolobus sp. F1]
MFALGFPKKFKYERPLNLSEALKILKDSNTKALAGGQSLIPMLKLRVINVEKLVDINELKELKGIEEREGAIKIGSLTTHNEIATSKIIREKFEALAKSAWTIADLQVRNRGTIGGSIAHTDPSGNYFPILLTLDANVVIVEENGGKRKIKLEDFVKGPYTNDLREGELIESVEIPLRSNIISNFNLIKRGGASYPTALVAVTFEVDKEEIISSRISIGGVFEKPVLFKENPLLGVKLSELKKMDLYALADSLLRDVNLNVISDSHGSKEYRIRLARNLLVSTILGYNNIKLPKKEIINDWHTGVSLDVREVYAIKLRVNGEEIEGYTEARKLLLDFLRDKGFVEVKRGCDEGKCGACTVLIDGKSVKSCNMLAIQAINKDIRTIKGLGNNSYELNYLQKAFLENYAMQCGYCTHGFMMVTHDYLNNVDPDADKDVMYYAIKNICRCTGYINIINAIKTSAELLKGK